MRSSSRRTAAAAARRGPQTRFCWGRVRDGARRADAAAGPEAPTLGRRSGGSAGRASPGPTRCRPAPLRSPPPRRGAAGPGRDALGVGWLLDPLRRVERVLIKSTGKPLCQLDRRLVRAAAPGPRQASPRTPGSPTCSTRATRCTASSRMRRRARAEGAQVYLELVLDDGGCLFRPVAVTPFASAERCCRSCCGSSPTEPSSRIVEDHSRRFWRACARDPPPRRRGDRAPIPSAHAAREIAAIIPFRQLSATAADVWRCSPARPRPRCSSWHWSPRRVVASELNKLSAAFDFFGLRGSLTIASSRTASRRSSTLAWRPRPRRSCCAGCLRLLPKRRAGSPDARRGRGASRPALLSPALTYEDGSIYFGGAAGGGSPELQPCRATIPAGCIAAPAPARRGAAEIALIDRARAAAVGGFAGHLFGDAYVHVDLAERLAGKGIATWCSGAVEFWILDDAANEACGAFRDRLQDRRRPARPTQAGRGAAP